MARASDPIKAREVATAIVRRLREAGHIAYFNGGCVRDELLGLRPTDFDVATDATPPRVRSLFQRTSEVGAAFGVVLVHDPSTEVNVEVATFRSDGPYTDARRPDVVHFSDPERDAQRRDFTINALFLDPLVPSADAARVIDYVNGRVDLRAGIIRAVGDPEKRLAEDHLRALRAVRFAARLGFAIEPGTADAIRKHAAELRGVSRERIGEEMRRMLAHPSRAAAVGMLQLLGLDAPVLDDEHIDAPPRLLAAMGDSVPVPTALAAWALERSVAKSGAPAGTFPPISTIACKPLVSRWRTGLCLSNQETVDLRDILDGYRTLVERWPGMRVSQRKRAAVSPWFDGALRVLKAAAVGLVGAILEDLGRLEKDGVGLGPVPLVTGDDLVAAGYKPGPVFKRVLDQVLDAQLEGLVRSKAAAMELAARLYV